MPVIFSNMHGSPDINGWEIASERKYEPVLSRTNLVVTGQNWHKFTSCIGPALEIPNLVCSVPMLSVDNKQMA